MEGTALKLKLSACETLPGANEADCRLLSLGFRGTFGGMAQTQLSSSPAAIEVDGGVESSHGIRFLARGDDEDTLGLAALRTLTQINRHAAWKTRSLLDLLVSEGSRLEAILIDSKQAWRVNGTFRLSTVSALGPADTLAVGIDVGLQVVERGELRFTLTTAGNNLEVAVRKLASSERVTSESFGAELDLSGLTRRIFPKIRSQLGEVDTALGRVLELLPDKQFVDAQLGPAIATALQRFAFKAELIAAIGLDPHMTIEQRLTKRIADFAQRAESFWDGSSQATVDAILDDLIGRLHLRNAEVENSLRESLRTGLRGALTNIDKALKENVEEAIRTGRRTLIGALNALDEDDHISRRVSNLATLSQKVRNRIGRYQGFVAKLGDRIEQSADRRIGLRASAETQRLRTTGAEIRLRFDPRAPEADELLRRLLLSDVETVFAEALRGDVAGPVTVVHRAALRDLLRKSNFTGDVGDAVLRFDSIRFDPDVLGHVFSLEHRTRDWIGYRRKAVTALAEKALLTMWAVYHSGPLRWPVERYSRCQLELGKAIEHWFDRSGEQAWTFGLRGEIQPLTLALLRTLLDLADPDPFTPGPFLSVDLELLDANGGVVKRLVVS